MGSWGTATVKQNHVFAEYSDLLFMGRGKNGDEIRLSYGKLVLFQALARKST